MTKAFERAVRARRAAAAHAARTQAHIRHDRARGGVDVLYIAEMLGHSSPAITQGVYRHVRRDRLNAAMQAITEAIDG